MAQPDSVNASSQPIRPRQPESFSWAELAAREAAGLAKIDELEEYELYQARKHRDEPGYEHRRRAIKARFDRRRDQVRTICQSYRVGLSSEMPDHRPEPDHTETEGQQSQPQSQRGRRLLDR